MPPTTGRKSTPMADPRLPTCRNYWRFGSPVNSPPQRPPPYLLKPHMIASSTVHSENGCDAAGSNPNSKYYKLRHGIGAGQFSPLNDDILMMNHQYRVRLPFDPTPFRGVTRFAFWISFLSILILLAVLITSLLRVEDFHVHDHDKHRQEILDAISDSSDTPKGDLSSSLIFKTLLNRHQR